MRRHRKSIALVGVLLLAIAGSMFWVAESGAVTDSSSAVVQHGLQPNGNDFVAHTYTDKNFCLSDVPQPEGESPVSISQCAVNSSQEWFFAQLPNGAVGIIDGSGQCLQNVGGGGLAVALDACTLGGKQQFVYSASGQITTTNGKFCLEYAASSQSASVHMQKCSIGLNAQIWQLSH
jgi:Ricin-type beta-trefoil lectin domain